MGFAKCKVNFHAIPWPHRAVFFQMACINGGYLILERYSLKFFIKTNPMLCVLLKKDCLTCYSAPLPFTSIAK